MSAKAADAKLQRGEAAAKKGRGRAAGKKAFPKTVPYYHYPPNPVGAPPGLSPGTGSPHWPPLPSMDAPPGLSPGKGRPLWPPPPPQLVWSKPWQKRKGKGSMVTPMVPWNPEGQGSTGGPGWTCSFYGIEFWYASTNEAFDRIVSTTGIDCSKGKYRGRVFCHDSRENAEATAIKFKIARVHKINMAAMECYYSGRVIWTHSPKIIDVSDLPQKDRNFVRPQFIESFEVGSTKGDSPQMIFTPFPPGLESSRIDSEAMHDIHILSHATAPRSWNQRPSVNTWLCPLPYLDSIGLDEGVLDFKRSDLKRFGF